MKKSLLILTAVLGFSVAQAQDVSEIKYRALDASPVDLLYFPLRAPNVKADDPSMPVIRINYSRPQKNGRVVFGELEKFGTVWRLGANENTEIRFSKEVEIGGKKVAEGTYSMFAIPNNDSWTIILNKQTDRWGAFTYDEKLDLLRTNVPVTTLTAPIESFSMMFAESTEGANLYMAWDNTQVMLPIKFKK